jgi:hypothetical protein
MLMTGESMLFDCSEVVAAGTGCGDPAGWVHPAARMRAIPSTMNKTACFTDMMENNAMIDLTDNKMHDFAAGQKNK